MERQTAAAGPMLGFVGGTGPHGRGLTLRFAAAGHHVVVGSRDAARAEEVIGGLPDGLAGTVEAEDNPTACARADIIFVTVPYDAQRGLLPRLRDAVGGKLVVSCANPLVFDERGPRPLRPDSGSAAEEVAALLPSATVVGAFQNVSAVTLRRLDESMDCDVLICGDDVAATATVARLVDGVPGLRPIDAGPLRLSGAVEALTAVLLAVNATYKTHAGVRLAGVDGRRTGFGTP